jgi:hypothetical protein
MGRRKVKYLGKEARGSTALLLGSGHMTSALNKILMQMHTMALRVDPVQTSAFSVSPTSDTGACELCLAQEGVVAQHKFWVPIVSFFSHAPGSRSGLPSPHAVHARATAGSLPLSTAYRGQLNYTAQVEHYFS